MHFPDSCVQLTRLTFSRVLRCFKYFSVFCYLAYKKLCTVSASLQSHSEFFYFWYSGLVPKKSLVVLMLAIQLPYRVTVHVINMLNNSKEKTRNQLVHTVFLLTGCFISAQATSLLGMHYTCSECILLHKVGLRTTRVCGGQRKLT